MQRYVEDHRFLWGGLMAMIKYGEGKVIETSEKPFAKTRCRKCGVVIVCEPGEQLPDLCDTCTGSEE